MTFGISVNWNHECKGASLAGGRFDRHPASMFVHDESDDRQAYSGSFIVFRTVQAFEQPEDLLGLSHVETDAVILYRQDILALGPRCR